MTTRVLITGGAGSIGRALGRVLERQGVEVAVLDLHASGASKGDVREPAALRRAMHGCSGVVHLAAVSRVAWGEADPLTCRSINVGGTRAVIEVASEYPQKPWVLFASSREVYGEPAEVPVSERAPHRPVNVYGRSKAEAEMLVGQAAASGLHAAIARLSNVYGGVHDHADRVVPSFVRAALHGSLLEVAGTHRAFDFTHIDDTVRGLCAMVELLQAGEAPPPIHLVSGSATTLGELATMAIDIAGTRSAIRERSKQGHDVSRFVGDPRRARAILGWEARISLREGLECLIRHWRGTQSEVSAS